MSCLAALFSLALPFSFLSDRVMKRYEINNVFSPTIFSLVGFMDLTTEHAFSLKCFHERFALKASRIQFWKLNFYIIAPRAGALLFFVWRSIINSKAEISTFAGWMQKR